MIFSALLLWSSAILASDSYSTILPDNLFDVISGSGSYNYIKFSIEIDENRKPKKVYFQNKKYTFHFDFLKQLPQYQDTTSSDIDAMALKRTNQKLILGSVIVTNHHSSGNSEKYGFELLGQDPYPAQEVRQWFRYLSAATAKALKITHYRPAPEQRSYVLKNLAAFTSAGVSIDIPQQKDQECYNSGWTVARTKLVLQKDFDSSVSRNEIRPGDLLITDKPPRDLPPVAGLITGEITSPHSHSSLLAKMMGIPSAYIKDVHLQKEWQERAKENQVVYLRCVGSNNQASIIEFYANDSIDPKLIDVVKAARKKVPLEVEKTVKAKITSLRQISRADKNKFGAKAANLGQLMQIIPDNSVKKGLAVPLDYFNQFMSSARERRSGLILRKYIDQKLTEILSNDNDMAITQKKLKEIAKAINKATGGNDVKKKILSAVAKKFKTGTKIRIRSSSNVEDSLRFNGAGLYVSKGACTGDDDNLSGKSLCPSKSKVDPVFKEVKAVWAGLYTLRGFLARKNFQVDESRVAMGVLIHPSFDEMANGVAIGATQWGYQVESTQFAGEENEVANPPPGKQPEKVTVSQSGDDFWVDWSQRSSEQPVGRPVLNREQAIELFKLTQKVYQDYTKEMNDSERKLYKLDFEWKLMKNATGGQKIVIKQVRPVPQESTSEFFENSIFIGSSPVLACPTTQEENTNFYPIKKLKLARRLKIGFSDVTLAENVHKNDFINWIQKLSWNDVDIPQTKVALINVHTDQWGGFDKSKNKNVTVTYRVGSTANSPQFDIQIRLQIFRTMDLKWAVNSIAPTVFKARVHVVSDDYKQSYEFMKPDAKCDLDAYQGFSESLFNPDIAFLDERRPPHKVKQTVSVNGKVIFSLEGRSSNQGLDKTLFFHIDQMSGLNLGSNSYEPSNNSRAVYLAAHHNFSWQVGVDFGLSTSRKWRYIVYPMDPLKSNPQNFNLGLYDDSGQLIQKIPGVSENLKTDVQFAPNLGPQ